MAAASLGLPASPSWGAAGVDEDCFVEVPVRPAPKKPKLLGAVVAGHKVHAVLPVVAGAPAGARTKIVWYVDGKKVGKGHKLKLKARWRGLKLTCTVTTTWGKGHHKHTVIKKSKAKRIKG